MIAPTRVILDANVFVTSWTLDVLLTLADFGYFEPRWSEMILVEATEAICRLSGNASTGRVAGATRAYPGAMVAVSESDFRNIELPDPDDRHVVAAAIRGGCGYVVTYNLRDFPAIALEGLGVAAIHPDEFLTALAEEDPEGVADAVRSLVEAKRRPPRSMGLELQGLRNNGIVKFAAAIEGFLAE